MIEHRAFRLPQLIFTFIACTLVSTPAFAVNKDMVQLQTEIQDLQEAVAHLQQSNDERMGVFRDLIQQTTDSVNKMSVAVGQLQQQMRTQQEASGSKLDQVSGQVQSLNDSLDEVKAHLNSLDKSLQSVQNQQQSINAAMQNIAPSTGLPPGAGTAPAASSEPPSAANQTPSDGDASKPPTLTRQGATQAAGAASAQSVVAAYNAALNDYMAAKYSLATTEFGQVIQTNPSDPRAGNSYYYLGEIDYRAGKYTAAIKDYDHVLSQYPSSPKVPVSRLHKGQALLQIKEREAAIAEFRALIQRFPNSQEAVQARSKLSGMGVRPAAPRNE